MHLLQRKRYQKNWHIRNKMPVLQRERNCLDMTEEETKVEKIGIYDIVVELPNCTVQLLKNSVTGEETWGWYNNDDPPVTVD